MDETDVMIVGAGPIGLELAVALKHVGVSYLHVDAGQIGQTVSWYPKQAQFFSSPERIAIAGVPLETPDQTKATREQYLAYLRSVVRQFDLPVRTFERVVNIEREGDRFVVTTTPSPPRGSGKDAEAAVTAMSTRQVRAGRLVLAIGDMHRPRRLNVEGEDLPHVSHYFDEPHPFFRQRLLIVGGRNSAVEAALRCHRAGARVTISYRGERFDAQAIKYWLLPEIESLIKHGEITFHPRTLVKKITPDVVTLQSREMPQAGGNADMVPVEADFVLLMTGYEQDASLLELAGVELAGENRAPVVNPDTMESNVPGVFIAGTAAAGTQQRFRLFIENCHPHVTRIVRAITGSEPPAHLVNQAAAQFGLPES